MRYALICSEGNFHGKYRTLKEALDYGRKHLTHFRIWDTLEDRVLLSYE